MFKVFLGFIFFIGFSARAEFKEIECGGVDFEEFSSVYLEDGAVCRTVRRVQKLYSSIKTFAGEAEAFDLFIQKESYRSFGTFGKLVALNERQLAWGDVRTQKQNEMIWAHELGHVFFSEWLVRDFEAIRGFRDYMREDAKLLIKAKNPLLDTSKELASKWRAEFSKVRDIQAPFNELFADLVAVLLNEDPMTMTNAMKISSMPNAEREKTKFYGFAGEYNLDEWEQGDVHFYFAPVRAYIGKHMLKFPMHEKQKSDLLKKVYQESLSEINHWWAQGKVLSTSKIVNKRLIEKLDTK